MIANLAVAAAMYPAARAADTGENEAALGAFFSNYCIRCHGEKKQRGNLTLHQMPPFPAVGDGLEKWRMVAEQIQFRDMPPEDSKQPEVEERAHVLGLIRTGLLEAHQPGAASDPRLVLPEFGNYVDHETLFGQPAGPVVPAAPSLWRLRPGSYKSLVDRITEGVLEATQPYSSRGATIRDYSALSLIDEPAVELLLRNADLVVGDQERHPEFGEIYSLLNSVEVPGEEGMAAALRLEFRLAVGREPTRAELARFFKLWEKNLESSGHPVGSRATLAAVLMLPEVLFRFELGSGEPDSLGRRRLTQKEIARSVSLALRDEIDGVLYAAASRGELASREQVQVHVARLLGGAVADNPRLQQFFREFFDYEKATEVFKDAPDRGRHDASLLVADLEALILHFLELDQEVLRHLLTTDRAFVNWRVDPQSDLAMPATNKLGYVEAYGLPPDWKWTRDQPVPMPHGERSGVLTHPAWLVAHSLNSENDPVRRGKWVRTHLLGGSVPDVPIGVVAKVEEDPHRTLRERLGDATGATACWRCHQKMDPLGLPFEQFSHFGRFRLKELQKPVDTRGQIDRTGDVALDGVSVSDPSGMVATLAGSERVEQVFVRHAFRFFLGRNETLGDAATLQNAWRAYRQSGGSFRALVASLLTSESFIYRKP